MKVVVLNPPSRYAKNVVRDVLYGCWCKGRRIASARYPPLSLLYIATVLKEEGHKVEFLDSQIGDKKLDDIKEKIKKKKPEVIVVSTSTMTYNEDAETLKEIKEEIDVITMAFGSHVTFRPQDSLKREGVDIIVMREPEYIIRDVINSMENGKDFREVRGIGYKENGKVRINPPYPFIDPLDELPIPDRSYIANVEYFNPLVKRLPWTTALTSRGCPGRCNFCTSPSFYGTVFRFRSAENVLLELEYLSEMGYKEIFFRDETFTANRKRVEEICKGILERDLDLTWICNARVGTVNKDILELMKKAGCHYIKFGVESGSQKILDNINKGIKVEMTRKTFKWCKEVGIDTHAHLMVGCIGETWETINETIKFIREIEPTTITCGAFTPYPGTKVFEMVEKERPEIGDGSGCDLSKLHITGYYNEIFCDLSEEEVGEAVKKIYRSFYLRPSYILKTLARIRSLNDIRRVMFAGLDILFFSLRGED